MAQMIICEKPSTALKIAEALTDGKPTKKAYNKKVPYYDFEFCGKKIFVVCAVGHLYTVAEKDKKGWTYPVFDVEWKPSYEVSKESFFTKSYLLAIKKLAKESDSFVVACDWDVEGEVIGYNILHFLCKKEDAKRMQYSTTTKTDLLSSYKNVAPHIDKGLAESGITRHILDFYWGINTSRALTLSLKNAAKMFKILSTGRVQGPTLKILVEREREIKNFKPIPFWEMELLTNKIAAWHKDGKFFDKKLAEKIYEKTKGKKPVVASLKKTKFEQEPPPPFDLTALQIEAHKQLGLSPKQTLTIAQELYLASLISYPRTSSNQYPTSIDFKKILSLLKNDPDYKALAEELLRRASLKPNNGEKKDPAHPAIYVTGEMPAKMEGKEKELYDLIIRRFLATFAEPAIRETMDVEIDVNKEIFVAKGTRTAEKGWHKFYGKYAKFEEAEFPEIEEGETLQNKGINIHDKETQPSKRYNPASIIKELEKRGLGTKSTRSEIVDNLFQRNYVKSSSIEVTQLGLTIIDTLENYCPEILDEELTKQFEKDMEEIKENKKTKAEILDSARVFLTETLSHFKENEQKIGEGLAKAVRITRDEESIIGKCEKCGSNLRLLKSKKFGSWFVACSNYPNCSNTFSLPYGLPKPAGKACEACGYPQVLIIRKGKRPYPYCINKACPKKLEWQKQQNKT